MTLHSVTILKVAFKEVEIQFIAIVLHRLFCIKQIMFAWAQLPHSWKRLSGMYSVINKINSIHVSLTNNNQTKSYVPS